MIDENFKDLVAKDVKGDATKSDLAVLQSDIRSWLIVLNGLKRDVEIQLAAYKARMPKQQADYLETKSQKEWLQHKAEQENWRLGAIRFMVSVEDKIQNVKKLRAEAGLAATA